MKKTSPAADSPATTPKRRKQPKAKEVAATPPRKKMSAKVFVKIWKGEMEVKGTEWESCANLVKNKDGVITLVEFSGIEVKDGVLIEGNKILLPHLAVYHSCLISCTLSETETQSIKILENSSIEYFRIEKSTTGNFWIWGEITVLAIVASTTGDIEISGATIDSLSISQSTISNLTVGSSKLKHLLVQSVSRLAQLSVWGLDIETIDVFGKSYLGHLQLSFSLQQPSRVILEDCFLGCLDLNSSVFSEFTTVNISDCQINQVSLKNFCNYGTVFFNGLKPIEVYEDFQRTEFGKPIFSERVYQFKEVSRPSTLRLTDSDLGKIQFINCDLRQFQRFEFSNTKMLDVFVAGSQMPGNKAFCLPNDGQNPSILAEQKRLAYGQFKKIYEARGDIAGSLRYLSYEMRAYRAMLSNRIKRQQPFSKQWFDYVGELGILWLNQFSTNYGNNWLRGVVVTLFVTVVCFSIYCFLLGYRPQPIGGDWGKFGELASHSLAYLNPFRDEDSGQFFETLKEDGLKITWYARLWDYLSRIFIAYFVYQTIQAFRKLGKSSG